MWTKIAFLQTLADDRCSGSSEHTSKSQVRAKVKVVN
jgi:hypothetical protein